MKWLILQILPPDLYFAFTWPHVAQKFGYSNFFEHDTLGYQKKNFSFCSKSAVNSYFLWLAYYTVSLDLSVILYLFLMRKAFKLQF